VHLDGKSGKNQEGWFLDIGFDARNSFNSIFFPSGLIPCQ